MFSAEVEAWAEHPCIRDGDLTLSYADLHALGRELIAAVGTTRVLVALRCSLTPESIAAYVALLSEGHVPLLIEESLSVSLAQELYRIYRPNWILTPATGAAEAYDPDPVDLHPDLALLLTTSGSTGSPKVVRLSQAGVRANAEAIAQYLEIGPGERALLHLPMSYSYGLSVINSHLVSGGTICLARSTVMEPGYWADLGRYEATSIAGVPFHYSALRRFGEERLGVPSLKTLTQAGGRLDPRTGAFFGEWAQRTGRRFVMMYGQTEAGPRIAYLPPQFAAEAPDAIGVPVPGVTIGLVDEEGADVADGMPGEMIVHGPSVMMGYAFNAADLALGDLQHGKLATGDLATRGADGLLRIVGRRSRMLKIYGLRVNLDEVDAKLAGWGHLAHCFGEDDKLRVLIEGQADAAEIRQRLVETFSLPPRGMEVRCGASLERSGSGKLSAEALDRQWNAAGVA